MARYESVVSLGYFCSVALENQRIGLRSVSLPFDWLIASDFRQVLHLMQTRFDRFLREEDLYQEYSVNPKYYYDAHNAIHFYHDFSAVSPLAQQLPAVREKYQRRIRRLYETASRPTLFVRYCCDAEELEYINANYESILQTLKAHHHDNHIIFVYDRPFVWREGIDAFYVKRDLGNSVARTYLRKNPRLRAYIRENVSGGDGWESRRRYWVCAVRRAARKVTDKVMRLMPRDVYVHQRQIEHLNSKE